MLDMVTTNPRGIKRYWSNSELLDIRTKFIQGTSQNKLAKLYNTSQKTISGIVRLLNYKNRGIPKNYNRKLELRLASLWLTNKNKKGE